MEAIKTLASCFVGHRSFPDAQDAAKKGSGSIDQRLSIRGYPRALRRRIRSAFKAQCKKRIHQRSEDDETISAGFADAVILCDIRAVDDVCPRISSAAYDHDAEAWDSESVTQEWRSFGITICRRILWREIQSGATHDRVSYQPLKTLGLDLPGATAANLQQAEWRELSSLRCLKHVFEEPRHWTSPRDEVEFEEAVRYASALAHEVLMIYDIAIMEEPWNRINTMPYDHDAEHWEEKSKAEIWQEFGIYMCRRLLRQAVENGDPRDQANNMPMFQTASISTTGNPNQVVNHETISKLLPEHITRRTEIWVKREERERGYWDYDEDEFVEGRILSVTYVKKIKSRKLLDLMRRFATSAIGLIDQSMMDYLDEEIAGRRELDAWFRSSQAPVTSANSGHEHFTQLLMEARGILSYARDPVDVVQVPW